MTDLRRATDGGRPAPGRIRTEAAPYPRSAPAQRDRGNDGRPVVFDIRDMSVYYGEKPCADGTSLKIQRNLVTAVIGPSGCGKSTFIRSLNRMNDSIPSFRLTGQVLYHGHDVYAAAINRVEVRRRHRDGVPEAQSLPEVDLRQHRLGAAQPGAERRPRRAGGAARSGGRTVGRGQGSPAHSALGLSGGQQQRLCIARAIAVEPDVLLLDEPASALDPISTAAIEDLMHTLKSRYTIVIVTHNMQQAARVADRTAFFSLDSPVGRAGTLIEYGDTGTIFRRPADRRTRGLHDRPVRLRLVMARTRRSRRWPRPATAAGRTASSTRHRSNAERPQPETPAVEVCSRCRIRSTSFSSASAFCSAAARWTRTSTRIRSRIAIS